MKEINKLSKKRNEVSMRNFRYMRYITVRYVLALFFFSNLYWALFSFLHKSYGGLLPLALLMISIPSVFEQKKLYWEHSHLQLSTKRYFKCQLVINNLLFLSVWYSNIFKLLYSFLKYKEETIMTIYFILLVGLLALIYVLHLIKRIESNKDKRYRQIVLYERKINERE